MSMALPMTEQAARAENRRGPTSAGQNGLEQLDGANGRTPSASRLDPQASTGELLVGDAVLKTERDVMGRNRRHTVMSDLIDLIKPSITMMSVLMAAGGIFLAPTQLGWPTMVLALFGTGLAVGSANALNMFVERESDKLMNRTRRRPLPDGRLSAAAALSFGLSLGALAMLVLWVATNPVTTALGAFALLSYVLIYTPLKRRSPIALLVGAIPGAIPPLMGWTAVTGRIDAPGLVLFAVLALWQLPHFIAISIYCRKDYERAGIRVVSAVRGEKVAKWQAAGWATILLPVSLLLVPMNVAGWLYAGVAALMGIWFWSIGLEGLRAESGVKWARKFFLASLVYLPVVTIALALDVILF